MDACTIIAKNYLAHARVLARSFKQHHPGSAFHVLVIDDSDGYIDPAREPFELVAPGQLDIEGFERMAVIYDVLELATAVKPWLLRWMLARSGGDGTIYLDPDMRVYAPLTHVFELVRSRGLVLTPHNLEPMPRDGKHPNEQQILSAGAYNLGFIGIGSGAFADTLLDWWGVRLERDCIVDPARGYFVDQRWIDLVPGMADSFALLRDFGVNVAYWNLPGRELSERDGRWWVNGDIPLCLFHFSGFDPQAPHLLSRHQDRIRLSEHPDLARLCRQYAGELLAQEAGTVAEWAYTFARTRSGLPLDIVVRRLYRDLLVEGFDGNLFTAAGEAELLDALNAPAAVGGRNGISRYLAALHALRPDLQRAYPDLDGVDADGYLGWADVFGRHEVPIHDKLLQQLRRPSPGGARVLAAPELGVNVAGYLNSVLGVGQVARQALEALETQGIHALPVSLPAPVSDSEPGFVALPPAAEGFPLNLVCVNADMLPAFAARVGPAFFRDRHTAGWWWWETSAFPDRWHAAFTHVDEVWAGSRFVADALTAVAPVPVLPMPTPVQRPVVTPAGREALGLPDGFLFLFTFDFHSSAERKNPIGLIDAFTRAFPAGADGPSLVVKCINGERHLNELERLRAAAATHRRVRLVDRYVPVAEKNQMLAACDCYVSLHRSEGFGLGMAEAMLLERPVIATGYSGNRDFMSTANSFLVDHALRQIGRGADPYPAEGEWAEPDLDHAAALMRHVVEQPEDAARRAARGAHDVARSNSVEAAGAAMARRLRHVHARMGVPVAIDGAERARARAGRATDLLERGSVEVGGPHFTRMRRLVRRSVLRAIKPHTAHQRRIDDELTAGLESLAEQVAGIRAEAQQRAQRANHADALLLAQLRSHQRRLDSAAAAAAEEPLSDQYDRAHASFVAAGLDDPALLRGLREGGELPSGFGPGLDERVVELPWVASRPLRGRVLDAGSTLNHLHVLWRVRPRVAEFHMIAAAPPERSYPQLGISYIKADLRDLPIRDATYDRVISVSTLEQLGLENRRQDSDPQRECLLAARELRRVVQPGGELYITVPVGRGERVEGARSLTLNELEALVAALQPTDCALTFYCHEQDRGWRGATRDEVADARYRARPAAAAEVERAERPGAAEAVACLHAIVPTG